MNAPKIALAQADAQPEPTLILKPRERKLLSLQDQVGGVAAGIHTNLRPGRQEVTTAGLDPNLQLIGSDPWGSETYTGLVVPTAPTLSPQTRYLFQLARMSFNTPESAWMTGLRLYTSLFGYDEGGAGPYEFPITSPMWRFTLGGGNISIHVMVVGKTWRDRRNPLNTDSVIYLDTPGVAALLYLTPPPNPAQFVPTIYAPPNAGRPWGKPIASDLGNIHDAGRYPWGNADSEVTLNIPIPAPCDVVVYASVWQHAITTKGTPNAPTFSANQFTSATPEDRFWASYANVQYGRVAASLIVSEDSGKEYAQGDDE